MSGFMNILQKVGQGADKFLGSNAGGYFMSGLGSVLEGVNYRKRQRDTVNNQIKLMGVQQKNQEHLNRQGADLSFENWLRTSYPAQLEQMKKAGLSPGLMYGQGGGQGGTTAGSGGSASGGNAPFSAPMDIGNQLMEASLLKSQRNAIDSGTNLNNAKAKESEATTSLTSTKEITERINQVTAKLENARKRGENEFLIKSYEKELKILDAQLDNLEADTSLKDSQTDVNVKKLDELQANINVLREEKLNKREQRSIMRIEKDVKRKMNEKGIHDKDNWISGLLKEYGYDLGQLFVWLDDNDYVSSEDQMVNLLVAFFGSNLWGGNTIKSGGELLEKIVEFMKTSEKSGANW